MPVRLWKTVAVWLLLVAGCVHAPEPVSVTQTQSPPPVRAAAEDPPPVVVEAQAAAPVPDIAAKLRRMTLEQIDRHGAIWIYRPTKHKNAHRGHRRMVALGAAAQAVIVEHLAGRSIGDTDPLFSPRRQRQELFAAMRSKRKTKVQPSQVSRKKTKGKRLPGETYKANAIGHAVGKACLKAGVPGWTPYQLRHLKGAELREKFTIEHVRAALGHSHASMTAHYATGADEVLAAEVARATG